MPEAQRFVRTRMFHVVQLPALLLVLLGAGRDGQAAPAGRTAPPSPVVRFDNPLWSPDGAWIVMSNGKHDSLYVYSTHDRTVAHFATSPSSGYAYNWSHDGTRLGFKVLIPDSPNTHPLQRPVAFCVGTREWVPLHPAVQRAGVPSFAADGRIAFTIDRQLRVADQSGRLLKSFELDNYANLAPISPDGTQVAYNDPNDRIRVIDLATGATRTLIDDGPCFNPIWSPDSTKLVVTTLTGRLRVVELAGGPIYELGEGSTPSWAPDNDTVVYSRIDRLDGIRVNSADTYQSRYDGGAAVRITEDAADPRVSARISPDGRKIAFVSLLDGEVYTASLISEDAGTQRSQVAKDERKKQALRRYRLGPATRIDGDVTALQRSQAAAPMQDATETPAAPTALASQNRLSRTVPYLHQVYDTPDDFNGHWACGATSAMMGISYYEKLPYWDTTCSWPYSHVSHYGRYVSDIYTFNGHTYNIGSPDPNGDIAYGGYGYIVRNDWLDTKGYMRDYFNNHGVNSSVDWSPSWSKLQAEINSQYPCVVLNSLTTSGHYILAIGYFDSQRTAIFNDPYGNKNTGYMNYSGAGACYDWPGYNNGYQNLNTVHCFIYARSNEFNPPAITQHPSSQSVCPGGTATFAVSATGAGTLTYRWQKNGADLNTGGHYSGVTTTTLTVSNADAADLAEYRCVVTNAFGTVASNAASLSLKAATAVTQQPADQTVNARGDAVFSVTATGDGAMTYRWQKDDSDLTNGGHYSGASAATLNISNASVGEAGTYRCVVTAGCGQTISQGATLTVIVSLADATDLDRDGDVDLGDFSFFQMCFNGPNRPSPQAECVGADFDGDGDVDLDEFAELQSCFNGPNRQPACV